MPLLAEAGLSFDEELTMTSTAATERSEEVTIMGSYDVTLQANGEATVEIFYKTYSINTTVHAEYFVPAAAEETEEELKTRIKQYLSNDTATGIEWEWHDDANALALADRGRKIRVFNLELVLRRRITPDDLPHGFKLRLPVRIEGRGCGSESYPKINNGQERSMAATTVTTLGRAILCHAQRIAVPIAVALATGMVVTRKTTPNKKQPADDKLERSFYSSLHEALGGRLGVKS